VSKSKIKQAYGSLPQKQQPQPKRRDTHAEYLERLAQDPRAKKAGKTGEGITIIGKGK
jgi:hypothetical protein